MGYCVRVVSVFGDPVIGLDNGTEKMILFLSWILVYFFPMQVPMWFLGSWVFAGFVAMWYQITKYLSGY